MGCGCGKKGNRAKNIPTSRGSSSKSKLQILRELWNKDKQEKKKTKVTKINNKT